MFCGLASPRYLSTEITHFSDQLIAFVIKVQNWLVFDNKRAWNFFSFGVGVAFPSRIQAVCLLGYRGMPVDVL